jgi:16S rRNA (guanine527-N7)-methyltransferase
MSALQKTLSEGIHALSLEVTEAQQTALLDYIGLLSKWNKVYNLTAVREPEQMLSQHVLDCLAALPPLLERFPHICELLDVGAGAGLPSVVFAIACPHWRVTAVDAVAKKVAFIQTTAHSLGLTNVRGVHARVEMINGEFDVVTCRAFATLKNFCESSRHVLRKDGVWLSLKAKLTNDEVSEISTGVRIEKIQPINVPGSSVERCLVWMRAV